MANGTCGKTIVAGTIDRGSTVFFKILYIRLLPHIESKLGRYQAGFRPRKLTIIHIFVLQQILEKIKEFRTFSHLLFIDFKSAYDSTDGE